MENFLLKMGIFQPAMLVYQRVAENLWLQDPWVFEVLLLLVSGRATKIAGWKENHLE